MSTLIGIGWFFLYWFAVFFGLTSTFIVVDFVSKGFSFAGLRSGLKSKDAAVVFVWCWVIGLLAAICIMLAKYP
ncbi:MAG: hypothetical protein Q7S28_00900 [bacterium]|nr:hypothetical protein [bacterium]